MICLLLALAVILSLAYNALTRLSGPFNGALITLRFNAVVAGTAALTALIIGWSSGLPSRATLFWGMLYGLISTANLITRMKALENGPLTATLLIGCSSMLLTTLLGTMLWHETVSAGQIAGVGLMLAAMALSLRRGEHTSATRRWPFYAMGLFLTNAVIGLIYKAHQSTSWAHQSPLMVMTGFFVSALLLTGASLLSGADRRSGRLPGNRTRFMAALCGCVLCAGNLLNTRLSGAMPSVMFFPIFNGAVIVFSAPLSVILFHERISRVQLSGIILAVAAILLISRAIPF